MIECIILNEVLFLLSLIVKKGFDFTLSYRIAHFACTTSNNSTLSCTEGQYLEQLLMHSG